MFPSDYQINENIQYADTNWKIVLIFMAKADVISCRYADSADSAAFFQQSINKLILWQKKGSKRRSWGHP